jgi:hypothetical protein
MEKIKMNQKMTLDILNENDQKIFNKYQSNVKYHEIMDLFHFNISETIENFEKLLQSNDEIEKDHLKHQIFSTLYSLMGC